MKFLLIFIFALSLLKGSSIPLPSSSPVDVFDRGTDIRGVGYYQFNVEVHESDEGYTPSIPMGTVNYEGKGLMYLWSLSDTYVFLGLEIKHFESAISAGTMKATLEDKANPKNYLDKSGFFVGYHPAFSSELYSSSLVKLGAAASLPLYFYKMAGDWRVVQGAIDDGVYKDDEYGFAFKPTATMQGSVYILDNLALSAYLGFSYFASVGVNYYSGGKWQEEDDELTSSTSGPKYLYGWDLSLRSIFSHNDSISLSSAFTQAENSESDNLAEYRLLYMFSF